VEILLPRDGGPIETLQPSFERYHPRPPTASSSLRLGFATPTQNCKSAIAIISGTRKATNFKFGRYIHRVHPNKSPLKILEKMERERIHGLPKFFDPLLSQELVKLSHLRPPPRDPPRMCACTLYFQKLESSTYIFCRWYCLSLFKFVQWARRILSATECPFGRWRSFKVIQGRWIWYQSKVPLF